MSTELNLAALNQIPSTKARIASLHYLTDDQVSGNSHALQTETACRNGLTWVQLRTKDKPFAAWEEIALSVQKITRQYDATLIINDNVHLASRIHADGVHLGKTDMPVAEARKILGPDFIIGGTANTADDIFKLADSGADYIGLGPFRFSNTKKNLSPVLNPAAIGALIHLQHDIPVILIGGIALDDFQAISETGAHGVAVSSAINFSLDAGNAARDFVLNSQKYFRQ
jgi:thiamine-phosphate pyrophosphorylase